jgi:DNA-binding transcriptional regulator YbjK
MRSPPRTMNAMPANPVPRPIDRQRRERIIEAAIDVLRTHGLEGLTHRRVAATAEVPLGAIAYYFNSIEALLAAALDLTVRADLASMQERIDQLPDDTGTGVAELLAQRLCSEVEQDRQGSIIAIELFAAAARRDAIREIALEWDRAWVDALAPRVGRIAAEAAVATAAGLLQRALLEHDPPSLEQVTALLHHVLDTKS